MQVLYVCVCVGPGVPLLSLPIFPMAKRPCSKTEPQTTWYERLVSCPLFFFSFLFFTCTYVSSVLRNISRGTRLIVYFYTTSFLYLYRQYHRCVHIHYQYIPVYMLLRSEFDYDYSIAGANVERANQQPDAQNSTNSSYYGDRRRGRHPGSLLFSRQCCQLAGRGSQWRNDGSESPWQLPECGGLRPAHAQASAQRPASADAGGFQRQVGVALEVHAYIYLCKVHFLSDNQSLCTIITRVHSYYSAVMTSKPIYLMLVIS